MTAPYGVDPYSYAVAGALLSDNVSDADKRKVLDDFYAYRQMMHPSKGGFIALATLLVLGLFGFLGVTLWAVLSR